MSQQREPNIHATVPMNSRQKKYDSTVARIAGNILSGRSREHSSDADRLAVQWAVSMARAIVAETERTEPTKETI